MNYELRYESLALIIKVVSTTFKGRACNDFIDFIIQHFEFIIQMTQVSANSYQLRVICH
jgi:hypothetical protein